MRVTSYSFTEMLLKYFGAKHFRLFAFMLKNVLIKKQIKSKFHRSNSKPTVYILSCSSLLDGASGLRSAWVRAKRTSTGCPAPHTLGSWHILCTIYYYFLFIKLQTNSRKKNNNNYKLSINCLLFTLSHLLLVKGNSSSRTIS